MKYLPVCLNIEDSRILIVGGGRVALQKARALLLYTNEITVCAPGILSEISSLGLSLIEAAYSPDVLEGFSLVYACTSDTELNRKIREDARAKHILANVVDDPSHCDFVSPAIYKDGNMSVAVSSNAEDVRKSIAWRDAIREQFGHEAGKGNNSL